MVSMILILIVIYINELLTIITTLISLSIVLFAF